MKAIICAATPTFEPLFGEENLCPVLSTTKSTVAAKVAGSGAAGDVTAAMPSTTAEKASKNANICDAIQTSAPLFVEESLRLVSSTTRRTVSTKVAEPGAVKPAR
jgi:hypothetical protein